MDANFDGFNKTSLKERDKGKFVLLRKCKVVVILSTHKECRVNRHEKFDDDLYSIQEIMPDVDDLGFTGYASR